MQPKPPKPKGRPAPDGRALATRAATPRPGINSRRRPQMMLSDVAAAREFFWQNTVRDMLTGLSVLRESRPELFDGRLGVVTQTGERLPLRNVFPAFACGVPGSDDERAISVAVECTVFRLETTRGEMLTLPLSEIRGLFSLTPDVLRQLEEQLLKTTGSPLGEPFGFAAFTHRPKPPAGPGLSPDDDEPLTGTA